MQQLNKSFSAQKLFSDGCLKGLSARQCCTLFMSVLALKAHHSWVIIPFTSNLVNSEGEVTPRRLSTFFQRDASVFFGVIMMPCRE